MAWNQPGSPNNNPWGKKPAPGGGDLDQTLKDWQKRVESLFGGGSGSTTPVLFIGIAILALWMLSGFYRVEPGNQGVVQRFGRHVETVGDGWGWRLPWPIEMVTKVDVAGVKSIDYKSSVLTAEPNMVELQVAVQYRIKNAEDNLFKVRDPAATLSEVSESAIREVVGRNDQHAILEGGRIKIADDTRTIMQRTLDQYGAGIEVTVVNITDVQVPEAVQQAQRDSVKAKADRERMIKEAQAYANGILPKAQGDAARAVQEAEAYKSQVTLMATGEASRFSAVAQAYEKSPAVTRERLYIETVELVLKTSRKVLIDPKSGNGNMLYLPLDKILERGRETDMSTVTVRPPAGDADVTPSTDTRQRVER